MAITPAADVPPGAVTNRISHLGRTVQFHLGHVERHWSSAVSAAERGDWTLVRYDLEHIGNHIEGAQEHMDKLVASLRDQDPAVAAETDALDAATREIDDQEWQRQMRAWR